VIPFWLGLALSSLLAYPIFLLLLRLNSRQKVSEFAPETHQAKQGTPTMGGLIFVIPFALLVPFLGPLVEPKSPLGYMGTPLMGTLLREYRFEAWGPALLLFLLFAVIGFVDDFVVPRLMPGKRGLGWKQKLAMQILVAIAYTLLIKHGGLQAVCDVFIILACANAYNFADGLDGLATSVGLLLIPGLIIVNLACHRHAFPTLLMLLAGCMLPFAYLNAPKAKVFMGDVGSLAVGALVGAAITPPVATWPPTLMFPAGLCILALVLAAELLPVPIQILWVKTFKRRLFPFTPIHHAFEKAGWPETRVVALFALAQFVCTMGCITLLQPTLDHWILDYGRMWM